MQSTIQSVRVRVAVHRAAMFIPVLMLSCALLPLAAAELGTPEIRSYLGEQLEARIALHDVDAEQISKAKTGLAPPIEWARQGAGIFPEALQLTVNIEQEGEDYYIAVRSENPINDPVLQLLVDLQMPDQALTSKPYVLFLDPKSSPGDLARQKLSMRRAQRAAETAANKPAAKVQPTKVQPGANTQISTTTTAVQNDAGSAIYGPVRQGETLWAIALKYAADSKLTPQQWLLALQQANPNALVDPENVNTLRSEVMLNIPSASTVAEVNHYAAVVQLRAQNMAWSNSGGRLQVLATTNAENAPVNASNSSIAALRIARLEEELLAVKRENAALHEQVEMLNTEVDQRDQELERLRAPSDSAVDLVADTVFRTGVDVVDSKSAVEKEAVGDGISGNTDADQLMDGTSMDSGQTDAVNADAVKTESGIPIAAEHQPGRGDLSDLVRFAGTKSGADNIAAGADNNSRSNTSVVAASTTALAAQMPDASGSWLQQISWLPDSTSGMLVFGSLLLLLLGAVYWVLRGMFSRSSDDTKYQDMLNELNRHRRQSTVDSQAMDDTSTAATVPAEDAAIATDTPAHPQSGQSDGEADESADHELHAPLTFDLDEVAYDVAEPAQDEATEAAPEEASAPADSRWETLPPLSLDIFADEQSMDEQSSAEQEQGTQDEPPQSVDEQNMPASADDEQTLQTDEQLNFDPFADSITDVETLEDRAQDDGTYDDSSAAKTGSGNEIDAATSATAMPVTNELPDAEQSGAVSDGKVAADDDDDDDDDDEFDSIEIKLDLARAYLAMGDYQAMQILLQEIGGQGTPAQRAEMEELRLQAKS